MTSIHAKVLSTEKFRDEYRLIVELVPSEFLGPFERLRFKKNPYCGSFGTSLSPKAGLRLITAKTLGSRLAKRFRFGGPIRTWKLGQEKRFRKTTLL
jgi:hypothetical protein